MLEPILCDPVTISRDKVPLLPKLRGHFAEFLNDASPVGLRILSSSTCVGLRYGQDINYSGFSRHGTCGLRYFYFAPLAPSDRTPDLPCVLLLRFCRSSHSRLPLPPCVPTVLLYPGTGISTCSPSDTRLRLSLGPDLPGADQLYPGILGYSARRILTFFSLLIPAFSLQYCPHVLPVMLRPVFNAPLPERWVLHTIRSFRVCYVKPAASRSFGDVFQPRTFSAQDLSTSELLRTL